MTKGKAVAVIVKETVKPQGNVFVAVGIITAGIIVAVYDRALRVKYTDAEGKIVTHIFTRRINGLYVYDLGGCDELGCLFLHRLDASNDGRRLLSPRTAFRRRAGRYEVI
jgi:hypothetical protein